MSNRELLETTRTLPSALRLFAPLRILMIRAEIARQEAHQRRLLAEGLWSSRQIALRDARIVGPLRVQLVMWRNE